MSNIRKIIYVLLLLFCVGVGGYIIYTSQPSYSASTPSISLSGTTLNVGETKKVTIKANGGVVSADGYAVSNDPSCIRIDNVYSFTAKNTKSAFTTFDTGDGVTTVATVTITGLKECSTTISLKNVDLGDTDLIEHKGLSFTSGTFKVVQPTTKTTTQAPQVQQPQAQQNQQQESQPKASGSSNNLLSSLVVSGYELNKKFKSSVTNYQINVGSAVKSINIDAKPQDSNAKVSITGNNSLKSGTNNITIVVTAENGSKKKYVVTVVKELDPNEPQEDVKGEEVKPTEAVIVEEEEILEENNTYLKELVVSNVKLNKKFDKKEHIYYYNKSKDNLVIDRVIPEIEANKVTYYTIDKATIIIVENDLGDKGFYLLIEKNTKSIYFLYVIIGILLIVSVDLFIFANKKKKAKE